MKIIMGKGIATAAMLFTAACGGTSPLGPTPTAGSPVLKQTRFLAFGDSLTEGKLSDGTIPAGMAYSTRIESALGVSVVNAGRGGEPASASLARFEAAIAAQPLDAVLILHGVNDGNQGDVDGAARGIESLVSTARSRGLAVYLATVPPFSAGYRANCIDCAGPLNDRIRKIEGVQLVDIAARWSADMMGEDGIHPNAAGYAMIADAFISEIRR